jgi:copper(I)-binding protein
MRNVLNFAVWVALAAVLASAPAAAAHEYKVGDLMIDHPWIRATPAGAKTAGGYARITNHGKETEKLIGGSASGAAVFEIHEMTTVDNVMKMRRLDAPVAIEPGKTLELKPGGYHLMLIGLNAPYKQGEKIKATLIFEKAGTVEIEFKVEPLAGKVDHDAHGGPGSVHKSH